MTEAELRKALTDAQAEVTKTKAELETTKAALTAANTATEVAKKDEVIKVGDIEVRKSVVGDTTFAVMKAQQEEIELHKFSARVTAEIPNLPGEVADKAKALRALSTLEAPVVKTLTEMLKGGNAAMKGALKVVGADGGTNADDPNTQLDNMAVKLAGERNITKAAAFDEVLKTAAGQALYNAAENAKRHAA